MIFHFQFCLNTWLLHPLSLNGLSYATTLLSFFLEETSY